MADEVAKTYAIALFEAAQEAQKVAPILSELEEFLALGEENPQLLPMLSSPMIAKEEREQLLEDAFAGKMEPYLLNFLKILSRAGRIPYLPAIRREYRDLYFLEENIQEVIAVTAVPMSEAQKKQLVDRLERSMDKKILLQNQVDPSLLGGVVLKIGNRQLDDSVKSRLEAVRRQVMGTL